MGLTLSWIVHSGMFEMLFFQRWSIVLLLNECSFFFNGEKHINKKRSTVDIAICNNHVRVKEERPMTYFLGL